MTKLDDLNQLIVDLRELSYETGWIAGKIEGGKPQDDVGKKYQETRINQCNNCYQLILGILDDLRMGAF